MTSFQATVLISDSQRMNYFILREVTIKVFSDDCDPDVLLMPNTFDDNHWAL